MSRWFSAVLFALAMQLCGCAANHDRAAEIDKLERRHDATIRDVGCGRDGGGP